MRLHKKINLQKANLISEQHYLATKGIIKEEFDWDSYIDNQDLSDRGKDRIKRKVQTYKGEGRDDNYIQYYVNDDIEFQKEIDTENKGKDDREAKLQNIKDTVTLLGKRITDIHEFGVHLNNDTSLYIDDYGNSDVIVYDNDVYKRQSAGSARDYQTEKERYENSPEDNDIIFPTKKEAKTFLDIIKTANGKLPKNVKAQFIYTPDAKEKPTKNYTDADFQYLVGKDININEYGDTLPMKITDVSYRQYNGSDSIEYSVFIQMGKENITSLSDMVGYNLDYKLKLGRIRASKKESTTLKRTSYGDYEGHEVRVSQQPDVMDLIDELQSKFK